MCEYEKEFKELGKRIKNLRLKNSLSVKELSKKTGINVQYLYKIERGTAYGICINTHISYICNALNIKFSELFVDN